MQCNVKPRKHVVVGVRDGKGRKDSSRGFAMRLGQHGPARHSGAASICVSY